jgi:hypothetical protein
LKASGKISSRTAPSAAPGRNADSSSSTAKRFGLTGPSLALDPRVHAYRKDIADIALAGQLIAPHYARPVIRQLATPITLRADAQENAEALAELAAGEEFAMLECAGEWAWGYRRKDHLVGYIPATSLEPAPAE